MSANEPNYPPQIPARPEGQTTADRTASAESAPLWQPEMGEVESIQPIVPAYAETRNPAPPPTGFWTAPPAPPAPPYAAQPNYGWPQPVQRAWQPPNQPWPAVTTGAPMFTGPQKRAGAGRRVWPLMVAVALLSASLSAGGTYVAIALAPKTADAATTVSQPAAAQQVGVAQSDTIVRVVNLAKPSVVTITSSGGSGGNPYSSSTGVGSGFIVNANGLILTNNHVVAGASSLTVTLSDSRQMAAKVVTTDPSHDLALIKIAATGLTAVTLGDSSAVQVGQLAITIGSPLGTFTESVTQGIVSGLNRSITVGDPATGAQEALAGLIQTDAAINPGNSGGPLLDASGNVVGIITASASNAQDMGFAIPINQAKSMISSAA